MNHPPSPIISAAEAIEAARRLTPKLAQRAAACEAARRCPGETIAELYSSGLMRMMQPRMFGGSELGADVLLEVVLEMCKACASTAWVWLNLATHSWNIGQFELQAQHDVWDSEPGAVAATGLAFPCGKAIPVAGGYRVSGKWPFGSGVDAASWMLVGALVERSGPPERRFFLVPQPQFRSLDDWRAYGLAGSGSHTVEVEDAFVPEHRTLAAEVFAEGSNVPGGRVHASPLYRLPTFAMFGFALGMVPLGLARAAAAEMADTLRKRAGTYTGARLAEMAPLQLRLAETLAAVDFFETQFRADLAQMVAQTEAGAGSPRGDKLRWKRNLAWGTRLAKQAMDNVMAMSGAGGLNAEGHLQRQFRDLNAGASHIALTWDVQAPMFGQEVLGLPPPPGFLV
jgi:3-hydroxy-9,10-secoandrosta-1,3,5(10)-triene-9,17-dione monooxygenase